MPVPFGFRNRLMAAVTAALLSLCGVARAEEPTKTLLHVAFDQRPVGPYDATALHEDWGVEPSISSGVPQGRLEVVADPLNPKHHVLRVRYEAQSIGGDSAMNFRAPIEHGHTSVWFQYRVMFSSDFDWVKGGKLPGLGGGDFPTGCIKSGQFDGFTTRLMWRLEGRASSYLYYPGKTDACGDDIPLGVTFERNRWYTITQQVILNDPGKANGVLVQYIDGKHLKRFDHQVWRTGSAAGIDGAKIETFFGGGSMDWAPQIAQYAFYDDFLITTRSPLAER